MNRDVILTSIKKASGIKEAEIEIPENLEFGDYSTNVAMILAKKEKKNALELAKNYVEKLKSDKELAKLVTKIEVAEPGFINFHLVRNVLANELEKVLKKKGNYGSSTLGEGKTVVIDYSSPNIAKHFGIGHLRSTVIGQALYNLYSFLGYKVIGDNHLGDWGTQFGAILAQIQSSKANIKSLDVDKLEALYVEFNKRAKDNPELWDDARSWFKKLEEGDRQAREIWKEVVAISSAEFERIYKLLDVAIDNSYGESFYEDKMPVVIEEVRKKGLSKKSEGAEIIELGKFVPAMLIKSDGTTTYLTRDLATLKFRIDKWNPDLIIYEVGSEQALHFRQLFTVAKLLSWSKGRELVHVAHGLIRFKKGKMSTRKGQTVKLEEVLKEATERAKKLTEVSKTGGKLDKQEKVNISKSIGIGAIKYFDLMHHPKSDIIFDWEKMFLLEGNSAPYLQYTAARTQSVLAKNKKVKRQESKNNLSSDIYHLVFNAEEQAVLRTIIHFSEVIEDAAKNYSPNLLCNYLFDLAQKYNNFYNRHKIIGSKEEKVKIAITGSVGQVLKNGLKILGIDTPERM